METLVGSILGGYTLTRVIGSGGMGTVYLAEDRAIGQQVAIKVVKTEDSQYADIMSIGQVAERFRQEARAVASLDHLHILPLYRYGEEEAYDGMRSYMVMQYRPEGSLWTWLRRRAGAASTVDKTSTRSSNLLPPGLPTSWPLQADEVADYVRQAASPLQYAHDRGFIHRDVKPENFLLRFDKSSVDTSYKAFLLLSDFGLAKFFSNLASNSQILGTPTYMAPEQFSGSASPESDQYALAIMAYCLLAGRPPFSGDPIYLMNQHLTAQPPSIRIFVPSLSAKVEAVLDKALAKTPSERYPSITEFADAFAQSVNEGQRTANVVLPSRPLFSLPAHARQDSPQKIVDEASPQQAYNTPREQNEQLNSKPDRSKPAAQIVVDDQTIYKPQQVMQGPQMLAWHQEEPVPQRYFSPQQVAPPKPEQMLHSDSDLRQRQDSRKQDKQVQQEGTPTVSRRSATAWIIGGVVAVGIGAGAAGLYFSKQTGNAQSKEHSSNAPNKGQTGNAQSKTHPVRSNIKSILRGHEQAVSSLAWSPDGSQLASGSLDRSVRLWKLGQVDASLIIRKHKLGVQAVTWDPAGTQVASGGRDDSIQIYNASDGSLNQTFTSNASVVISRIAWSRDGANLFISTLGGGLQKIILKDQTIEQEGTKIAFRALALSPDGHYLALGTEGGSIVILTLPALSRLLTIRIHKGSTRTLAWSPDSTQLASGGIDKTIQIFDISTQSIVHSLVCNSVVNDLAWKPQGSRRTGVLAAALANGEMQTWTPGNDNHTTYKGHTGIVTSVSWGTQELATGSSDKTIIIWNV